MERKRFNFKRERMVRGVEGAVGVPG